MEKELIEKVKSTVRNIPDFPVKGIQFKDLTTAFKDPESLKIMCDALIELYKDKGITKVVGIEARGFIFGAILAAGLGAGFVPLRKPGKLPAKTIKKTYTKEYGEDTIEIHEDAINENDVVDAGDIVAISGNTGKSTGPHLHLRLRKDGKSIDPQPFVNYLNDYIDDLQDRIATLKFGGKPDRELNIENLAKVLEQYHVKYPKIVIAQSLLETGYYKSRVCWECKNLFGLRRPSDGSYYKFDRWEDSVKAYRDYVQYKYKGGDYLQFLNRIGYAEDKSYVLKVRQIAKTL